MTSGLFSIKISKAYITEKKTALSKLVLRKMDIKMHKNVSHPVQNFPIGTISVM